MKPGAMLATNTSSIVLEPLAEHLARPERLTGLHFFNPVAQMPLIEIVHTAATDRPPCRRPSPSPASSTSCRSPAAALRASSSTGC